MGPLFYRCVRFKSAPVFFGLAPWLSFNTTTKAIAPINHWSLLLLLPRGRGRSYTSSVLASASTPTTSHLYKIAQVHHPEIKDSGSRSQTEARIKTNPSGDNESDIDTVNDYNSHHDAHGPNNFGVHHTSVARANLSRRSGKGLLPTLHRLRLSRDVPSISKSRWFRPKATKKQAPSKNRTLSLSSVTATFLEANPRVALKSFFEEETTASTWKISDVHIHYIGTRSYTPLDIASWSHVLAARHGGESIDRLLRLRDTRGLKKMPPFLLLHILQLTRCIKGKHVWFVGKLLDEYIELQGSLKREARSTDPGPGKYHDSMSQGLMVFRLMRMALRRAIIEVEPTVCLMEKFLDFHEQSPRFACWLTNRLICELGKQPRLTNPYNIKSQILLSAQHQILRYMMKFEPGLPVTRMGFRGLVSSTLAKRKDDATREVARHARPSWPPWKRKQHGWEDLYGPPGRGDLQLGSFGSSTEAGKILLEMEKAGYGFTNWEHAALILAGKEISGMPTIATRRFMDRDPREFQSENIVWRSRIQATRTLEEAWSIFLQYRISSSPRGGKKSAGLSIYKEMFGKILRQRTQIIQNQPRRGQIGARSSPSPPLSPPLLNSPTSSSNQRFRLPRLRLGVDYVPPEPEPALDSEFLHSDGTLIRGPSAARDMQNLPDPFTVVAGDALELHSQPKNPADRVYLPFQPPSSEIDMWDMMVKDGVQPDMEMTAIFLSYATSLEDANAILQRWEALKQRSDSAVLRTSSGISPSPSAFPTESSNPPNKRITEWWSIDVIQSYGSNKTLSVAVRPPEELMRGYIYCLTRYRQRFSRQFRYEFYEYELPAAVEMLRVYRPRLLNSYIAVMYALAHFHAIGLKSRIGKGHDRQFPSLSPILDATTSLTTLWKLHDMMRERQLRENTKVVHLLLHAAERDRRSKVAGWRRAIWANHEHAVHRAVVAFERLAGIDGTTHDGGEYSQPWGDNKDLTIPETPTLHLYFRLLIMSRWDEHETLLRTLRWMVKHKTRLDKKNRRLPLIAVRSILEQQQQQPHDKAKEQGCDHDSRALGIAKDIIEEGLSDWGGWPTEREVNAYRGASS